MSRLENTDRNTSQGPFVTPCSVRLRKGSRNYRTDSTILNRTSFLCPTITGLPDSTAGDDDVVASDCDQERPDHRPKDSERGSRLTLTFDSVTLALSLTDCFCHWLAD